MEEKANIKVEKDSKEFRDKLKSIYAKPSKTHVNSYVKTMPNGDTKEKYYETREYKDGAKKRSIIGIKKNNKQLWGREK